MAQNPLTDLQREQTDKLRLELPKRDARKCKLTIREAKETFLLQPTTRRKKKHAKG